MQISDTKTVKVSYMGQEHDVVIKRLTTRERNDCYRQATRFAPNGQQYTDIYTLAEVMCIKGIVSSPFGTGVDAIMNQPVPVSDQLFPLIQEYCHLNEEKKPN